MILAVSSLTCFFALSVRSGIRSNAPGLAVSGSNWIVCPCWVETVMTAALEPDETAVDVEAME